MVCIYILKLQNDKYYVGKTNKLNLRVNEHFEGDGSAWTKLYKPIEISQVIKNCDTYDEDKYTIKTMAKYGIDNVRGGSFVKIKLSENDLDTINKMINGSENKCFKCGKYGHFANKCYSKKTTIEDKVSDNEKDDDIVDEWDSFLQDMLWECRKLDKNNIGKLDILTLLKALKNTDGEIFGDIKETNIRGMCQSINKQDDDNLVKIDYITDPLINYVDYCTGFVYICRDRVGTQDEDDDNKWECSYCDKTFKTKKGAVYHQNFYCKNK